MVDDGNIELVLRVLQFMCEGYNMTLKAYIHSQPDNIRSIDLVAESADYLGVVIEEISGENISLITQVIDTLLEFSQGVHVLLSQKSCSSCSADLFCSLGSAINQRGIFNAHVVDHINLILRMTRFKRCLDLDVAKLKHSCALLMTSLLENNDAQTAQMAKQVVRRDTLALLFLHY